MLHRAAICSLGEEKFTLNENLSSSATKTSMNVNLGQVDTTFGQPMQLTGLPQNQIFGS